MAHRSSGVSSIVLSVGIGRVALNVHHLSDVVAGWALGFLYFVGCASSILRYQRVTVCGRNTGSARYRTLKLASSIFVGQFAVVGQQSRAVDRTEAELRHPQLVIERAAHEAAECERGQDP